MTGALETALLSRRDNGGKCLIPYLSGGLGDAWLETIQAAAIAGADAIEIGIPFSDPVMDGPTIQLANDKALSSGVTPYLVLDRLRLADVGVPTVVMTYGNIAYRMGYQRFAASLAESGVSGCILADIPLEEANPWLLAADAFRIETVLLAAPTASDERLGRIALRSRGFVYGVGLLGITGVRDQLAESAKVIAKRLKNVTERPVLVGVGVSTPQQAVEVCEVADGVVVGSAMVQRMLDGGGPEGVAELVSEFRSALDQM